MTYEQAKTFRDDLEATVKAVKFPEGTGSGPGGMTPDAVKATPAYRAARVARDAAHEALRRFNTTFVKVYAREIADDRRNKAK